MSLVERLKEVAYFVTEFKPLWIASAIIMAIMIGIPTIIASLMIGKLTLAGVGYAGLKFTLQLSLPVFIAMIVGIYIVINTIVILIIENL